MELELGEWMALADMPPPTLYRHGPSYSGLKYLSLWPSPEVSLCMTQA